MGKLIIILFVFSWNILANDVPYFFLGTYELKKVVPIQTRWSFAVLGETKESKEKLRQYRDDGFTCVRKYYGRYQCEKNEKGVIPEDIKKKVLAQYGDFYIDFEPHDSYKALTYNDNEWRFKQFVIINEVVFDQYLYSYKDGITELVFVTEEGDNLKLESKSRRDISFTIYENSGTNRSIVEIQADKVTP